MRHLLLALALGAALPGAAAADIGDNDLGINTHLPSTDLIDMSDDLGVSWIRVDANWLQMNPSSGTYDFAAMDRVVTEASARGLSVYMSLGYTPAWVARRDDGDGYTGNDTPNSATEWVTFVEEAVAHYAAMGVTHFGIWNEPNLEHFFNGTVDEYIDRILVPGADAVRRTCASCLALGPDLAHVGDYDVFLDRVLERAIGSFDIIAHHTYNGWPENGQEVWDGDRFLEALEMRRFSFTRISLRELLDQHGWTGEVWITETGYRAQPVDSASEDSRQEVYVTRVMEEQLARPWWTNTFFYEIMDCGVDQASCPIDGFGITRPTRALTAGGPRAFPDDYRLKPAYLAIRGFIAAHPEIVAGGPTAATPQCANGLDDDADGRVDSEDRGCANGVDDDESDDPARRTLEALPTGAAITIDGVNADWTDEGGLALAAADWAGVVPYGGAGDLGVFVVARWSADDLFLLVTVTDDTHVSDDADDALYLGDSLQLAIDRDADFTPEMYGADDHELNFALRGGAEVASHRFFGAGSDAWEAAIVRDGPTTTYELRLPRAVLGDPTLEEGARLGFSFLVNDDDGAVTDDGTGREGWLELTPGIGTGKDPYQFGVIELRTAVSPPLDAGAPGVDAGPPPPGSDAGPVAQLDAGMAGSDAGTSPPDPGPAGCGCRATGRSETAGLPWLALLAVMVLRRRR